MGLVGSSTRADEALALSCLRGTCWAGFALGAEGALMRFAEGCSTAGKNPDIYAAQQQHD